MKFAAAFLANMKKICLAGMMLWGMACHPSAREEQQGAGQTLKGVYRLLALQSQEDTVFVPMEGVEVLKIFTDSQWISPAFLNRNKKVVHLAGGRYSCAGGWLTEELSYHSKDTVNIGLETLYRIEFHQDTLYQSGIFKKGTPEEWKVEEYWLRTE